MKVKIKLISYGASFALCDSLCEGPHMPTNLDIDPVLLTRAVRVSGAKSKTAAVTLALTEFIARREQARLLELFGTLEWDPDFDYKRERSRR
jgi:Arc/MetJ family transcription regulator